MAFEYIPFSGNMDDLNFWMDDTLKRFREDLVRQFSVVEYTAAPTQPYDGQIVIADGTSWNPGSGGGFYGYYGGSWTFLG